jgi:tetratricopeptide (TPR) repeat protein
MHQAVQHGRRARGGRAARRRAVLAALLAALLGGCAAAPGPRADGGPLLDAVAGRFYLDPSRRERSQADVLGSFVMLGALSQRYGDAGECTEARCRRDFADTLRTLGMAYSRLGLNRLSLRYFELALANEPDVAQNHADVAVEQLALGRDEAALASIAQALERAKDDADVEQQAAGIYLLARRPQDALGHAERCIRLNPAPRLAQYCALVLALARLNGATDSLLLPLAEASDWPGPLLRFVRGEIGEAELVRLIDADADPIERRERLAEALYYAGETALARGRPELALRHFRANQMLKAEGYWETMASRRRIVELHGNADEPEPETPPSHVPIG